MLPALITWNRPKSLNCGDVSALALSVAPRIAGPIFCHLVEDHWVAALVFSGSTGGALLVYLILRLTFRRKPGQLTQTVLTGNRIANLGVGFCIASLRDGIKTRSP